MKKTKAILAVACVLAAALVALAGCGANKSATQGSSQQQIAKEPAVTEGLKTPGTLTVGIRASSGVPFYVESSSGISGLDVNLASSLADELGLNVEFASVDDVAKALADTCDIVMNVSAGEANGFDVIGNYASSAFAFFHLGEAGVVSADDLANKSVALQDGSSAQVALRITALNATEVPCESLGDAFDTLEAGKADFVLSNVSSGAYLCSWRSGVEFAGTLNEPSAQGIAIASGDGAVSVAVRTAYENLEKNGVLAETRRSWLGNLPMLSVESVVANVPMRETSGESLENIDTTAEVVSVAMDGSTAGSNAVTLSNLGSVGSQTTSAGTASVSEESGYGYTQNYNYGNDYEPQYYADTAVSDYQPEPAEASVSEDDSSNYASESTDYGDNGDYTESSE